MTGSGSQQCKATKYSEVITAIRMDQRERAWFALLGRNGRLRVW
jgi:hypothetical protein